MSIKSQLRSDKAAVSLSLLCVAHCFLAPSFIILSSAVASFTIDNEFIHKFILFVAVPISIYALYTGYKNHKDFSYIPMGIFGLIALVVSRVLRWRCMIRNIEIRNRVSDLCFPLLFLGKASKSNESQRFSYTFPSQSFKKR